MNPSSSKKLEGKVAVITGAAGVLCSVMAESLLREGAKVALLDFRPEAAQELSKRLAAEGLPDTLALGGNVLEKDSLEAACDEILARWGRIDILLNGAGGNHPAGTCPAEQLVPGTLPENSFFGLEISGFEHVNRLNLIGSILPAQVFCKHMKNGGSVINISSMSATQPLTKVAAYSAAKAAIENFTRWLAVHLAPTNIRVNAISPGFFLTEQNRFLMQEADGSLTPRGQKVIAKTPMHRFGEPKDLCGALNFLVSDDATFITGIVIPVDGGFLAYSGV